MIAESYVSFDTAKLLKEAGFDEVCRSAYYAPGNSAVMYERNSMLSPGYVSRPTQALAARWLREKHGLFIEIYHRVTGYAYFVIKIESNELLAIPTISDKMQFDIYEEAFENALRKAIKLIKK